MSAGNPLSSVVAVPVPPGDLPRLRDAWLEALLLRGSRPRTLGKLREETDRFIGWCAARGVVSGVEVSRAVLERYRRHLFYYRQASNGKPLSLPITSVEDQSTRTVRTFAVRVPEQVYERVKADKLDNGVIDNGLFGSKRRGARTPDYRFPVLGGFITRWED